MKEKRKQEMLHYIQQKEYVSIRELCDRFQISLNTVRRYVNELSEQNYIQKVYGGVQARKPAAQSTPFSQRSQTRQEKKQMIARQAARFIRPHDIVFIDSGTTTMHMLDDIPEDLEFTVITNSLYIMNAAAGHPAIRLISLPGALNRETMSFSGEDPAYLEMFSIHKAFMACTGLTIQDGATHSFLSECGTKRVAAAKAGEVFLLLDSSKFGVSTLMSFCPVQNIHHIITDACPDEELRRLVEAGGHEIILCGTPSGA